MVVILRVVLCELTFRELMLVVLLMLVMQHLNDVLEWRQFLVTQVNTVVIKRCVYCTELRYSLFPVSFEVSG